ncbi:MAG: efflux RND transporter periplasmic adaptor subunit [Chloroflexi bacterium]|nr:efflux RND transporter periplasmic adaptor subunit [Chloroflexota bacterium]
MTASAPAARAAALPRTTGLGRGRLLALAIVFLITTVVGYRVYQFSTPAPAAAPQTQPVRRGSIAATVVASGTVATSKQAKLSFGTSGRLKSMNVAVGDTVTAGQVLAELDTSTLEIKVEQARSSLRVAETKLQQLRSGSKDVDVAAAQAAYASAVAKYNDVLAGPALADIKSAEQAVLSAQANVEKAQKDLTTLRDGPTQDEIVTAKASVEKAQAALAKAQGDYDKIAWRADAAARPEALALQQATIDYQSALANYNIKMAPPKPEDLGVAEKTVQGAQAALVAAQEKLATLQAGSKESDLQAARSSLASARSALASKTDGPTPEDLALQLEQVTQSQLSLKQAELDLAGAKIVAPYSGVIAAVVPNVGEQVSGTAITIVDPTAVRIDATVDETDVGKVLPGQTAQITFDSLPNDRFNGKVIAVAPSATVQQGVVSYLVSVQFDPGKRVLPSGMTASVTVVTEQKDNVLLVPNRALRTQNRARVVQVQTANGLEARPVTVGLSNDTLTEVTSGLQEGETVVLPATTASAARIPGMGGVQMVGPGPAQGPR